MSEGPTGYQCAVLPWDEAERLRSVQRSGLLDSDPEPQFDRLASLARRLLKTPIALVSLIDAKRQYLMARQGLDVRETSRDVAFCAHAILDDDIFEVPDATGDPRFVGNPLVAGPPYIRYYAGKPLVDREGYRLGTLCVIDTVPRAPLTPPDRTTLTELAASVVDLIELRMVALTAESERQRTQRLMEMKDAFLATMAHELRTPLNAVTGFGHLLKMSGADTTLTAKQREYLNLIIDSGEYLTVLISETLEAEAIESGKSALRSEPVPLDAILASTVRLLRPLADKLGVTLTVTAPESLAVWGDPLRLRQVFINLASNAVKYNRKGGSVTLAARVQGDRVTVACADTGTGIAPGDIPNLFRAYHRVAENRDGIEGSGLGLRITRQLVQRMGGTLDVQSVVGEGSTFTVHLDRATMDAVAG
ncbi:sensor histidine kinase [Roseospira marina]|nr:GAF domain-containing sensor histidine kinase [Roseospira marina]MBB4314616.1 signal transduction histidine kinase [Roseospira marina]MBB5088779.1 signal transduction histidine kinase [Roseospira marina]